MKDRICKICSKTSKEVEFAKAGVIKDITYFRHICKFCYSESKVVKKKAIRDWIVEYKKTLKCVNCGNNDFRVLDFDHLEEKLFNIADASRLGYSLKVLKEEIAKCQILCANCHRIKTYEETHIS